MQRIITALFLALAIAAIIPAEPCWPQSPGLSDPLVVPSSDTGPLSHKTPEARVSWNLTDLLWGISRLQESPQKLSKTQIKTLKPAIERVVKGTGAVKNFEPKIKSILNTEQVAYIQHLAVSGALAENPKDLPEAGPGKDPLVQYVIQMLEKKAQQ